MSIDTLANGYRPSPSVIDMLESSDIVLLAGISGAGKDTIQSRLLQKDGYHRVVTHTTRLPRANDGVMERDGVDYHFVTTEQMADLLAQGELIEINKFGPNYYGASADEFRLAREAGKVALSNIDVNGIAAMRRLAGDAVRALFIVPPTYEEWRQRLQSRYASSEEFDREFTHRAETAVDELSHALDVDYYHFIINDDLGRVVRICDEIAHRAESFNEHDSEARQAARDLLLTIQENLSTK